MTTLETVPIQQITTHPDQPRIKNSEVGTLVESIKEIGLIEPLAVAQVSNDRGIVFMVISGHRRLAAVKRLKWKKVPVHVLFESLSLDEYANTVSSLLATNTVREDFTTLEKANVMQRMLDLGLSVEKVSKRSGTPKIVVETMTESAKALDPSVAHHLARDTTLSLDELEGLGLFANDESKTEMLLEALQDGHFEHKLAAFKKEKRVAENVAAVRTDLEKLGVTVIDRPGWEEKTIFSLHVIGIEHDEHRACPGHVAWISVNYDEKATAVFACLEPATYHDYKPRPSNAAEQKNIEEKRAGLQFKKDMVAPTQVRREWITAKLKAGTPWKKEWEFIAHALANKNSHTTEIAYEFAGAKRKPEDSWTGAFIGKDEKRSHRIALALIFAYLDEETRLCQGTDHYRAAHVPHYLEFLKLNGYTLSDQEQKFLVP